MVSQPDAISVESVLDVPPRQHALSPHIEEADFNSPFSNATTMTKARLQAISAPQAHAWLKVQLSPKLGLALMPDEAQVILKWWLGLPLTPESTPCPLCHHNMDAWGHHMLTCHSGGDVITRHTTNSGTALLTSATRHAFPHKLRKEVAFFLKTNQDQQHSSAKLVPLMHSCI